MREEFNNLYNQINTPEEWKIDIKAKMKAAMLEEQKSNVVTFSDRASRNVASSDINTRTTSKKKTNKMPVVISFAGVAVAAGIIIGIVVNGNSKVSTLRPESSIETTDTADYADVHFIDRGEVLNTEALLGGVDTDDSSVDTTTKYSLDNGEELYVTNIDFSQIPQIDENEKSYIGNTEVIIIQNNVGDEKIYSAYIKDYDVKLVGRGIEQERFVELVKDYLRN